MKKKRCRKWMSASGEMWLKSLKENAGGGGGACRQGEGTCTTI